MSTIPTPGISAPPSATINSNSNNNSNNQQSSPQEVIIHPDDRRYWEVIEKPHARSFVWKHFRIYGTQKFPGAICWYCYQEKKGNLNYPAESWEVKFGGSNGQSNTSHLERHFRTRHKELWAIHHQQQQQQQQQQGQGQQQQITTGEGGGGGVGKPYMMNNNNYYNIQEASGSKKKSFKPDQLIQEEGEGEEELEEEKSGTIVVAITKPLGRTEGGEGEGEREIGKKSKKRTHVEEITYSNYEEDNDVFVVAANPAATSSSSSSLHHANVPLEEDAADSSSSADENNNDQPSPSPPLPLPQQSQSQQIQKKIKTILRQQQIRQSLNLNYEAAYQCLLDKRKWKYPNSVPLLALLEEMGVYSLQDFMALEDEQFQLLALLLKTSPQNTFRIALKMG